LRCSLFCFVPLPLALPILVFSIIPCYRNLLFLYP
jgi:hypothetical protein